MPTPRRTVAVVGGHGKVARLLLAELHRAGHRPVALVRREEHRAELEALGAEVRMLNIESSTVEQFAAAFEGCDAVVFSAGGGPDGNIERKRTVDLEGSLKSMQAASARGIDRFVQVSAIAVDEPQPEELSPVFRAYQQAKSDADRALRASGLAWTIIRPGRLTDEPATGRVRLGTDDELRPPDLTVATQDDVPFGNVPRADVAAVLAAALDTDASIGVQAVLVGGDVPVADAVAALASLR